MFTQSAARPTHRWMALPVLTGALLISQAAIAKTCEVVSGPTPPTVVELYTSEGCSSCPPADRWLSTLNNQANVLPLAFHVNYWDRLGWQDRFATPATTQRQHRVREVQNGKYVYTPQVVLNGQDHRKWHGQSASSVGQAGAATSATSAPTLKIEKDGNKVTATIGVAAGSPDLAGYWAVLQDGLVSKVTRGENAGETLKHDHVVSLYQPVPAWSAGQAHQVVLTLPEGPQFEALRVAFLVTQPNLVAPVQGAVLQCPH